MKTLLIAAFVFLLAQAVGAQSYQGIYESDLPLTPAGPIDRLVFGKLQQLGIQPAHLCSDAVFVRRVFLDVIGTLPTAQEVRSFLMDTNPGKRAALIDQLLARDEFPDAWAMKWSDLLRVKSEFPINLWPNAAAAYYHWIRTSIKENKPYDKFARELLTGSGSNFRVAEVNFYRAAGGKDPQTLAKAVALTFMGMRAENWPKARLEGMSGFFARVGYKSTQEWKEEIVFFNQAKPAKPAVFPDGKAAKIPADRDPREVFADWLITPQNPYFTQAIANRAWSWLLGRGIIHEPDDIRPDNPPSNPELLDYLQKQLIAAHYDIKSLFREILNSKTYQLASIPRSDRPEAAVNFASYPLRRLDAEVLIDALDQITGGTEKYSSAIPEPFTFIPESHRSIALPDGSVSSSFLEMFGRPSRDTGWESERINRPTADQRLHMLNSSHIQRKLEQSNRLQSIMQSRGNNPRQIITALYLTILSRFPTETELQIVEGYAGQGKVVNARQATLDVAWALVNSAEFLYRH